MNKTEEIFYKKQFKAEVKSANVTDSGLALKLIVPFTEMIRLFQRLLKTSDKLWISSTLMRVIKIYKKIQFCENCILR